MFTIFLNKGIADNVTSVSFEGGDARIRQNNNYLLGTSDSLVPIENCPQLMYLNHTPGVLTLRLNIDPAPSNAINNDAC